MRQVAHNKSGKAGEAQETLRASHGEVLPAL
jgi:hypothetical protein